MANYAPLDVEKRTLDFWLKKNIYKKQKAKVEGKKPFYFLQGPPYTSGAFHIAHAWNNALKDVVLRYKKMQGFDVWDRAGWDMHGLPTENGAAKKLGLKTKEDIEKFGLPKFIKECQKFALHNMHLMENDMRRTGIWMDLENAYMPIKQEFMEAVWWVIKQAHEKKRIYEGLKVMTWCHSCGTALAKHELEYKTVSDDSVFLKFPILNRKKEFLIIWTTTPWTIPFNLAVMVNPELDYVTIKVDDERWVVVKELVNAFLGVLGKSYKILKTEKGKKLEGLAYQHPLETAIPSLKEFSKKYKWAHKILLSDKYVDVSAGTGLVHCAPGCGPEDQEVGEEYGLPLFNELDDVGKFSDKMGKYAGWTAKVDDAKFIEEFKKYGFLLHSTPVEHEYAHCWRCHGPVIFRATKQWFMKIEDLIKKMRELNKKVLWVPDWAGSRTFDAWLQNLRDNSISRQRYWGTPLPIWRCEKCKDVTVVGSVKELKKLAGAFSVPADIHRPWIDKVTIKCNCGAKKYRVPDIIDVWIDSGVTSFACLDYPQREELFKKLWPADFILEAIEQTRLWFYTLLIASIVSTGKHPYKAVYVHGMVNDAQGRKMSKSLGNVISPYEVIDKYGADTMRCYMIGGAKPGLELRYNFEDMKTKFRNLEVLWNTAEFLIESAKLAGVNPTKLKIELKTAEDKFMISKLHKTILEVTEKFEKYYLNEIPETVENLFLELSRWYIKTVRDRATEPDVIYVMYQTLLNSLKLFAPVAPFITEELYQKMKKAFELKEESIHLFDWPKADKKQIKPALEKEILLVQQIVSTILAAREKIGRGIRWPVKEARIISKDKELILAVKTHSELIKQMANVWSVSVETELKGVEHSVKVNYENLGPKFGDEVAIVIRKIIESSPESLLRQLAKKKMVKLDLENGKFAELTKKDFVIEELIPANLVCLEGTGYKVYLDKTETADMLSSGMTRELIRKIQSMRKDAGLKKPDRISVELAVTEEVAGEIRGHLSEIKEKVGADAIKFVCVISKKNKGELEVRGKKVGIGF